MKKKKKNGKIAMRCCISGGVRKNNDTLSNDGLAYSQSEYGS